MMRTAFFNGRIYTGELPLREAFWVEDDRFIKAGADSEILACIRPGDRTVDLNGAFVCAGFNDSHMHLLNFGQFLHGARLGEHTGSLREMLAYLKEWLTQNPPRPGQWVTGRGWNQDYFTDEQRMPDRCDLDSVSAEIPILITRTCGHCCVVNSAVLALAGIDRNTPDPDGGTIGHDADGEPDGRLYENAIELLNPFKPQPDKEALKEMLRLAMAEVNRYGVTSVQSDDYSTFRSVPWQLVNEAYRELEAAGEMTVRVTEQCNFTALSELKEFIEAGNVTGAGSDFFRIGPLKMLGDGSLGSRTAHLSVPYLQGEGEYGFSLFSPEQMKEMIVYAHQHGMQAAVHAIGDRCLDEVLDAYEAALTLDPKADHRHGIVHCQVSRADQLDRIAQLGLHVYAQSIFLDYDNHIVRKLVPEELANTSYSWKTLLRKGVCVSNGSDCPVELPNVMSGIQCAVTRQSLDGFGPFLPREAFTAQEALDSFTSAGAHASFEEHKKGRIQEGMLADFVILDQDPFETEPGEISKIKVLAVYLNGKEI
ncbi:MAG: amidohydrolase [Anaerolineaceae bacterium]|nr:amidohydrolase [Anaerolineaceae bacterium]